MKKLLLGLFCILILVGCNNGSYKDNKQIYQFTLKNLDGTWIQLRKTSDNKYEKSIYTFTYNEVSKSIAYSCKEYNDNTLSRTHSGTISEVKNHNYFIRIVNIKPNTAPEPSIYLKYEIYKNCIFVEWSPIDNIDWKAQMPYFK